MPVLQQRVIRPQTGPQESFLSTPADIAIYGGAAFGGKTWALTFEPLRHINNPGFGAVIFRRESTQVTNEGGLWDESMGMYPLAKGTPIQHKLQWKFPTGSTISFRHLQHDIDKLNWQGSQICMLGFDELTHFLASQFWYMISRNRSTCGVQPYVRATTNPEPGWVKDFLAQWVDKTHPDPADSGELRWMVRVKGEIEWAHTRAELVRKYPDKLPKSVTFIRASIYDNRIGMELDPNYLGNLQALPRVEQARLLDGDWDVKREGLIYPGLADCVCDFDEVPEGRKVGGIDFGWNHPFCALAGVVDHDDVLWVWYERYLSFCTLPTHSAAIPRDGSVYQADPSRHESIAELLNAGHVAIPCVHLGDKPVLNGIDRVTERINTGRLRIHRRCQNLLREANLVIFGPDGKPVDEDNHSTDALRYMIVGLDRGHAIPLRPKELPTPDQLREQAERDEVARQAKRAKFIDQDNPHWWGESDDSF